MILVTGGLGFIGSHTCVELQNAGYDIVVVDNLSNAKAEVAEKITAITGKPFPFYAEDVTDKDALRKIFSAYPIRGVIHFAGYKAVGESTEKPRDYYENNIVSTLSLLKVMGEYRCKTIVFSSSATVYGEHNPSPYTEDMPTSATNPYGWSKVMQEQILKDVAAADPEMRVALLRYFNPVGAHPCGTLGEDPNGIPNNLMPYINKVALGKLPKLHVFGNDYDTPDGTGVRDYIHVVDLAEGHLAALNYLQTHSGVLTVNLGTGKGSSVLDVVHAYEEASGKEIPLQFDPRRPGDIGSYFADPTLAEKLLGWQAKLTLADMCRDTWHFAQNGMSKET